MRNIGNILLRVLIGTVVIATPLIIFAVIAYLSAGLAIALFFLTMLGFLAWIIGEVIITEWRWKQDRKNSDWYHND